MFRKDGIIDIKQVMKDEYNYTFTNLEDLYSEDFIELEGNGVDALLWIKYKGEKYLFKPIKQFEYNVWGEILSEELAKDMNLECAEYRIATIDNMSGVLTKSFIKENETLLLGSELIQDYIRKDNDVSVKQRVKKILSNKSLSQYKKMKETFKVLNNYTDISHIINSSKKITADEKDLLKRNTKDKLFFDILTMQGDNHSNNWGIIEGNDYYRPAKLFDNAASFGLSYPYMNSRIRDFENLFMSSRNFSNSDELNSYITTPLMFSYFSREEDKSAKQVLEDMVDNLSDEGKERYYSFVKKFDIDYLDNVISNVERKNGYQMKQELRFYVLNLYELNRQSLEKTFEKKAGKNNGKQTI